MTKLFHIIAIVFFITTAYPQSELERANKKYESFAYVDAIKMYERLAEKGVKSAPMFEKLGNAYYFNAQLTEAAKWYGELFALKSTIKPELYYRYGQALKATSQYDKANRMLLLFAETSKNDSRAKLIADQPNYLEDIQRNSGRFQLSDPGINSEYSDYGSTVVGNLLIFTSARDTGTFFQRKHKWTNASFTNMYQAPIVNDSLGQVSKFASNINLRFHESTPVFSQDGKTMFFTRNDYNDGKKGKNSKRITLLKIYISTLQGEGSSAKWSSATELPFNSNNYNCAHPALSPDGKSLYFASDMPGTLGQADLFKVDILENGQFGKPQNLGAAINTSGRETFPFISSDNELYFASDGHPGLGGLDIFTVSDIANVANGPENIGSPANSPHDDFGYWINTTTRRGFLTSNRPNGKGNDDIYTFIENRRLTCEQLLQGIVTDSGTGAILSNAAITLSDANFTVIAQTMSDTEGFYTFKVTCGQNYYVKAQKESYNVVEHKVTVKDESGVTDLPIALVQINRQVTIGTDLAKTLDLEIIYFDLDKSDIRPDAAVELEKILDVLVQHPTMKIDVRSHTDSRQTEKYNESLSDRRAKATITWLVSKGIDASRLTGKGYGETQLLNKCADNIECSEEEHQRNRRSEFIITALNQ